MRRDTAGMISPLNAEMEKYIDVHFRDRWGPPARPTGARLLLILAAAQVAAALWRV